MLGRFFPSAYGWWFTVDLYSTQVVLWLFVLGWMTHRPTTTAQRWITVAATLVLVPTFFGADALRTVIVVGGLLLLFPPDAERPQGRCDRSHHHGLRVAGDLLDAFRGAAVVHTRLPHAGSSWRWPLPWASARAGPLSRCCGASRRSTGYGAPPEPFVAALTVAGTGWADGQMSATRWATRCGTP